jgi:two-component system cell cycle sensor histidine kinase/response regulator CckA
MPSDAPSPAYKEDQGNHRGFNQPIDSVVLLVEDDQCLRRALCEYLKRNAFAAIGVATAAEAYTQILELRGRVCALITDMVIPGGGGWELVQKTRHVVPDVVVIFISGVIDEHVVTSASSHPSTGFLQKPFELSALTDVLNSLLAGWTNKKGTPGSERRIGPNKKAG